MNFNNKKLLLILIIAIAVTAFYLLGLNRYLNLDYFISQQNKVRAYYQAHMLQTITVYFLIYVITTGLSLPGATLLTLIGGALFGLLWGTVIVSFASTLGATLSFLISRYLFRDYVQKRFASYLIKINRGIEQDGNIYLLSLRLIPIFPFFAINLAMGLTPIRIWNYIIISQLGMLAGTIVYINAGTEVASITSLDNILSPELIFAFILLGIFPLIAKHILGLINYYRKYKPYKKPANFDYNLIVIGGGSAGLVSAYIGAAIKAKVCLIEKNKMGGDCLNTGCVPSKAFIRSSKLVNQIKHAQRYGLQSITVNFDFAGIMRRIQEIIKTIEPHDSIERYTQLGVDCIQGETKIISPFEVIINQKTLTARNIIIASGATPFIPPIHGIEKINYLTSDNIWNLKEQPKRLLIIGGGPIGCELAQSFARLGTQVSLVEMLPRLLIREDKDVSEIILQQLQKENIITFLECKAKSIIIDNDEKKLVCEQLYNERQMKITIPFDELLIAVGRKAKTKNLGLETLGIPLNQNGTIQVNEYMQTIYPNIYACGDVAGPYQFTHTAAHQAWYCAVNALFRPLKKFKVDYSVIPWATFTSPEVARVGLNEIESLENKIDYEITRYDISDLDRAIVDSAAQGFVKVLTVPGKDKILGATIVAEQADNLITEFILAMKYKIGLNKILSTPHIYPTMSEANKYTAGVWKQNHAPHALLRWLARYHLWKRS